MKQKEKYISLKEASKISGYASDYIGQLIRQGKLPGKQVYSTVAWITTEESLRQYMQRREGKENLSLKERMFEKFQQTKSRLFLEWEMTRLLKGALGMVIIVSVGFSLFLFYIFSVNVDKKLQQNTVKRFEENLVKYQTE